MTFFFDDCQRNTIDKKYSKISEEFNDLIGAIQIDEEVD